ncbi:MAG TPA: DNA-binding protein WhiA, partial [Gaiella sp.]|nr:DNA-binding protein WhiA [Gaiella sp.]
MPPDRRRRAGRAVLPRELRPGRPHAQASPARARGDASLSEGRLSADARAELASLSPERRCDRLAELSALFHTAGTVHLLGRGQLSFHLDLAESAVARRAFAILRRLRIDSQIRTYRRHAFGRESRTQLHVDGTPHAIDVLGEAGVLGPERLPLDRPPGRVVARACCRSAYLRGAFLGAGSLSGPRSPHLEVRTPLHAGAAFVRSVASAAGVRMRVLDRESHSAAYAKSWDGIESYLSVAGASDTVLALEERALVAGLRADANRLANADHANVVRQSRSARAQVEAARVLRESGELEQLATTLQDAAHLRLRHPSLSLRELAERADPP